MTPVGVRLRGGEVLLEPRGVLVVRWAMRHAAAAMRADGIAMPADAVALAALVAELSVPTAVSGSAAVLAGGGSALSPLLDPVSATEVARMIGCKERNARDLCARGRFLTARRVGRRWLVERAEVVELRGAA